MNTESALRPVIISDPDPLLRAVAAYLARFKGATRAHTDSDLRAYLMWCRRHGLQPLQAQRVHVELYLRWMQEVREFKPSTISRRVSVVVGASTAPVCSTACWPCRRPTMSGAPTSHPSRARSA